ncbi:MAG TPA: EAL domain-containing protein [Burkholderiales bacterium]|nr:EAL domain-containing protein [Burkholderiales bacterium]
MRLRLRSLQSRIVVFFLVLLALVQGVALALLQRANESNARANIRQELAVGERIFRRLSQQNAARLTQAAEILSLDFAFREAVATLDLATIQSVLLNHGARIQADKVALVSLERRLIADITEPQSAGRPFAFTKLLDEAEQQGRATGILMQSGRAYQVAVVPVLAPTPIAWAVFGLRLDDRLAKDLRTLSALEVSFFGRESRQPWTALGATVSATLQEQLAAALTDSGRAVLEIPDNEALVIPLDTYGGDSAVVAVLARSLDDAMAPFRQLGTLLIVLVIGSMVASVLGSILIARGVTRPLFALSEMTRRIEHGDYAQPVEVAGPDEVSGLAHRFNLMREAIAAREAQVTRLAYRDPLSDLPNRTLFNDRLRVAIEVAKRSSAPLSVLLMDLDRFKNINDTLGHHIGDLVLQQVAQRLTGLVRKSDTTARLGGDEFAVLLIHAGVEEAQSVAGKIVSLFEQAILVGQQALDVRASVGVAAFPLHGEDADTLLRHADAAMYAAKRANVGVAVYESRIHERREEELSMLSELRQAIDQGELRLVYQPKVELASGEVTGAEALVRWQHPTKGAVPPDRFIPFAEQTGFIRTITSWVVDAAARQAAAWRAGGLVLKVSVNISVHDLQNPELIGVLSAALERHRIPADLMCLEITESGVMQDAGRASDMLKRLHGLGVGCSIDDFGTGYSSLTYIKQLHVDELKIDRSFIRSLVSDAKDRAIVLSTIELAHNLGLVVVAEGVEDAASAALLKDLGCDQMQGYLIARPLESAAFETWLAARAGGRVSSIS